MMSKKLRGSITDASLSLEEQKSKINDIRKMIGPIANKIPGLCSDASITRYLRARNWNTKKAAKMLKDNLKWRLEFKPEKIRWVFRTHLWRDPTNPARPGCGLRLKVSQRVVGFKPVTIISPAAPL